MNPHLTESDDRAELAALLPPPPGVPQLSTDRREHLKNHLMREIQPAARRSRRWVWVAAPAAAVALTVAVTAGLALRTPQPPPSDSTVQVLGSDGTGAAAFLNRVALVAGDKPASTIGANQYVYIRSRVAWTSQEAMTGPRILDPVHDREIWIPQSGHTGLIRERGETFGSEGAPSNGQTADLPSDPDALLKKIYRDTRGQGNTPDQQAFTTIGDILRESILAPKVTAALYRAAGKIPGVVLVRDSVDAVGRHGVAVARVEFGERTEWIFDKTSLDYLGERSYLVEDTDGGKAGMLTATTAVTVRAVVDKPGERP
jgi:hypothetical protein